MNKFLIRVGSWLMEKGNTKQELADRLGISTVSLNRKLDGEVRWTWDEVCCLADILHCNVSDFR